MSVQYNTSFLSPNFEKAADFQRRTGKRRLHRAVVVHTTEGVFPSDRDYLLNPAPGGDPGKAVSCHVYIRRDGTPYLMVDWDDVAWTQGLADESYRTHRPDLWLLYGYGNPNDYRLGVECEAKVGEAVTPEQLTTLAQVIAEMVQRYPLTPDGSDGIAPNRTHILGHYEINNHKTDPTQPFPWDQVLARVAVLLAPPPPPPPPPTPQRTYAETGHTVQGGFLEFFDANGGVARFGYPLTEEEPHPGDPSITRQVFENVQLEYNPALPDGHRVRLGAVGRLYLQRVGRLS